MCSRISFPWMLLMEIQARIVSWDLFRWFKRSVQQCNMWIPVNVLPGINKQINNNNTSTHTSLVGRAFDSCLTLFFFSKRIQHSLAETIKNQGLFKTVSFQLLLWLASKGFIQWILRRFECTCFVGISRRSPSRSVRSVASKLLV